MTNVREVEIANESVELYKLLKWQGLVASGGEAKSAIADGRVEVNGSVELRKRRKIIAGDSIRLGANVLHVQNLQSHD